MSSVSQTGNTSSGMPTDEAMHRNIAQRRQRGRIWQGVLFASTTIGMLVLVILLATIINESFGLIAVQSTVDPATIADRPLEELSKEELIVILEDNLKRRVYQRLEREQPLAERDQAALLEIVRVEVVQEEVVGSWPLNETLFNRAAIEAEVAEEFPRAEVQFRSWINPDFLTNPMSSVPALAGVRTALLGTLWMIGITILFAFPIGVGAAIYLEEYATDTWYNRIIQTNIANLAGVPSIIYGMLGLAIFVRAFEPLTSGTLFGLTDPTTANGRTILSAGLTMGLLILPVIIIAAQESIRAVPNSLRQASYGLGATKWQTIWNHVLPGAMPGILTGTILSVSRAIGETAPLIVVGASTFIVTDPDGPFSKFTALPIQIYNWTARPQDQFRDIAAAAIIVLLIVLLTLNAIAVLLRDYIRKRRSI